MGPYLWFRHNCVGKDYAYLRWVVLTSLGEDKCWVCMEQLANT